MLTYYSKGQKAEFVMTEQSAVRVESSGVSGNIFIKPPVGKERIISLNFAPFYTQLDDFDAGTIVYLSVDNGFGRVGIEVTGTNTVQIVNNQSLLSFKKGSRLTPPTVPAGEDGVLFIDQNGILCTVDKFGAVLEIGGTRLVAAPLVALSNIVIFEKSYEMMINAERTATSGGGGYLCFAVSGNLGSPSYAIYSSATENGEYLLDVDNVPYTPSALLSGLVNFDHRSLSVIDEYNFPSTIPLNTLSIIGDTTGQKELGLMGEISLQTIGTETTRVVRNYGVATHYSVPIKLGQDENARVYVLTAFGQDPIVRTGTRFYKIAPKDPSGAIKLLSEITAIPMTIINVRNMPNPPRSVRVGHGGARVEDLYAFPDGFSNFVGTEPTFGFKPSSKELDVTPSSQFNASGTLESGVVYKVDIEGLHGATTPVRTLTLSNTTGIVLYNETQKRGDGERYITNYTFYADKAGVKSLPFTLPIRQSLREPNAVETVALTQATGTVKVLVTLAAGAFPGFGDGSERNIYLVRLGGTLLPNVTFTTITVSAGVGAELLFSMGTGSSFYVQSGKSLASFELTIPFTGGVGLTLNAIAGTESDSRTSNTLTIV